MKKIFNLFNKGTPKDISKVGLIVNYNACELG